MGSFSIWHWIVVIAVILLLFGRGKISELMGDVAQGIKAFKKGMTEDEAAKTETPSEPKTIEQTSAPTPPGSPTGTASSPAASTTGAQQRS
jgi:sec-independent protein translocase protein TatA